MAKKRAKAKKSKPIILEKISLPETSDIPPGIGLINMSLKVCRLCEIEDGPFLNIFDPERTVAKKIQELMPFVIAENDDLPHIICFRCSAKVEELHEFVQKCIKTQKKMRVAVDRTVIHLPSSETRTTEINKWKDSLNKSKVTNDDICDAVIKKAMEYIKDFTVDNDTEKLPENSNTAKILPDDSLAVCANENKSQQGTLNFESVKKAHHLEPPKKDSTSTIEPVNNAGNTTFDTDCKHSNPVHPIGTKPLMDGSSVNRRPSRKCKDNVIKNKKTRLMPNARENNDELLETIKPKKSRNINQIDTKCKNNIERAKNDSKQTGTDINQYKQFNIMDYVSTIKVNGVGVLFQCKLCNRNFLKKDVVMSHGCAKNGTPKDIFFSKSVLPQPPKAPTVKYINTKQEKKDITVSIKTDAAKSSCKLYQNIIEAKKKAEANILPAVEIKSKPRIGPASKIRRKSFESVVEMAVTLRDSSPPKQSLSNQSLQMSTEPNADCRYKLLPGPNHPLKCYKKETNEDNFNGKNLDKPLKTMAKKRKSDHQEQETPGTMSSKQKVFGQRKIVSSLSERPMHCNEETPSTKVARKSEIRKSSDSKFDTCKSSKIKAIAELAADNTNDDIKHSSNITVQSVPCTPILNQPIKGLELPVFNVSSVKNQSYTIIQTENPNRLLISSKPVVHPQLITSEATAKRTKKI